MSVIDRARLIIYRINKKGLEVFLVNLNKNNLNGWEFPQSALPGLANHKDLAQASFISLEPVKGENGAVEYAMAVEGDWHDIPSIRKMLKDDVQIVKTQLKQKFPELEEGTYFAVKEAFKKVMPEQYAFLKELKDIVLEKNQARYI